MTSNKQNRNKNNNKQTQIHPTVQTMGKEDKLPQQ